MSRWAARLAAAGTIAGAIVALPGIAAAHGIGGRSDLPVPLEYFLVGAGLALVLSFVALAVLWPEPRLQDGPRHRLLPIRAQPIAYGLGVVGLLGLAAVLVTGIFGEEDRNTAAPVLLWVYFWLVIPFLSALVGNIWRWMNPWCTIAMRTGLGKVEHPDRAARWGVWPATVVFVAFTWLELVYRDSGLPVTVAVAAIVYTVFVLDVMALSGRRTALDSVEAFTTYNDLISGISPITVDLDANRLVWRGWLRALPVVRPRPGLTAFVVAMIGTVTYDGLSQTPWWEDLMGDRADDYWVATLGLLGAVALIGAGYLAASWIAVRISESSLTVAQVAASFAHTLVPIALAYAVAHYFTLVIFEGQTLLFSLSDPLGMGWDWFGTANDRINFTLVSPAGIWYVQLVAIVTGHVIAVVLAHDRALALFPKATAVRTQYAMLGLMVALTVLGLTLLATG